MREISVSELAALAGVAGHASAPAAAAPVVVDVREPGEYRTVRAPGVIHIPMDEIVERLDEIPDDGPVYVICALGGRSARVAKYLEARGIDAVNVAGGTTAWQQAGFPVESDA